MHRPAKSIVVAAPASGSGKTTLTLGIMHALVRRGLKVAPFKAGPDFIDPGYHRLATGTASVNLDSWICPPSFVSETFCRHAEGADLAIIEGVMGLFDGIDGGSDRGSTAEIAKLTSSPVLLVVDAARQGRSAAALVHGFASFDPALRLMAVIFNNVASENHERILREAVQGLSGVEVVGCFPRRLSLGISSRHLGLVTAEENPLEEEFLAELAEAVEKHVDLDRILELADSLSLPGSSPEAATGIRDGTFTHPPAVASLRFRAQPRQGRGGTAEASLTNQGHRVRLAVARDEAFCFVYQDNLELLEGEGAKLCPFSPLTDPELPPDIAGIYLPGGYPELFRERLAANTSLKGQIREAVEGGMPVYAECGGFIYLTRGIWEGDDLAPLVGLFPVATRMLKKRKALGYREVELLSDGLLGRAGTRARGHEFHYSEMEPMPEDVERIYRVSRKGEALGLEGYRVHNCLASYVHIHFGSVPHAAATFVEQCRIYQKRSRT